MNAHELAQQLKLFNLTAIQEQKPPPTVFLQTYEPDEDGGSTAVQWYVSEVVLEGDKLIIKAGSPDG